MKNLKSSGMFENLKPREEQKINIYNRIMEQESAEVYGEVKIADDNRIRLGKVLFPAAAVAAVGLAVGMAAFSDTSETDSGSSIASDQQYISELPEGTENPEEYSLSGIDPESSYTASVYDGEIPQLKLNPDTWHIKQYADGRCVQIINPSSMFGTFLYDADGNSYDQIFKMKEYDGNYYVFGSAESKFSLTKLNSEFGAPEEIWSSNYQENDNFEYITDYCIYDEKIYALFIGSEDNERRTPAGSIRIYSKDGDLLKKECIYPEIISATSYNGGISVLENGDIICTDWNFSEVRIYDAELNMKNTIDISDERTGDSWFTFVDGNKIVITDYSSKYKVLTVTDNSVCDKEEGILSDSFRIIPDTGDTYTFLYVKDEGSSEAVYGFDAETGESEKMGSLDELGGYPPGFLTVNGTMCYVLPEMYLWNSFYELYENPFYDICKGNKTICRIYTESSAEDYENVFRISKDGSLTEVTYPYRWKTEDIFITADNRIMVLFHGWDEKGYFLKELDTEKMTLQDADSSNSDYLKSYTRLTGFGKYDVFYINKNGINNDGVYGITDIDDCSKTEKIIDFGKVTFDFDSKENGYDCEIKNYICGFSVDEEGIVYLETSEGVNFKLEKKP